jgi:uncharacterized protein YdeI (YjbR/CyaY-like superfamily)
MKLNLSPMRAFPTPMAFRQWLSKNHSKSSGLWIRFFKKGSGKKSVTYSEALDEALCYGWIDGPIRKLDALSWVHRFTPRRPKSLWSKRNREHVARLTKSRRMRAAGLRAVEAAKSDGRWQAAYDSPKTAKLPASFSKALSKNPEAKAFFSTLSRAERYSICFRLQTAKKRETKLRWQERILAMLSRGEKFK